MQQQQLDPVLRIALEALWQCILSVVPLLARTLGKPNPLQSRAERLAARRYGGMVE